MLEQVDHTEIHVGSERSFSIVFTIVFAALAFLPALDGDHIRLWAVLAAAATLFLGLVLPRVFIVPNRLWCGLGIVIGSVTSQVVMVVFFFLVLTPTGLAMRLFGKAPPEHSGYPDARESTYWIRRGPDSNPMGSLRNQY